MHEVAGKPPVTADKSEFEPLSELRHTLAEHYVQKRKYFAWTWPANYDEDLRRIFSDDPKDATAPPATPVSASCAPAA
jgi:hypothetical protein